MIGVDRELGHPARRDGAKGSSRSPRTQYLVTAATLLDATESNTILQSIIETVRAGGRSAWPARLVVHPIWRR